jgi:membrane associated rhomboid family serine protease
MASKKFGFWFLWLSFICVIVYVLQSIIPGFTDGLLLNSNVFRGELWRFITAIFLHGSVVHLIYNLFALLLFGLILERLIGSRNFLIVFFASGVVGNIVGVNFYPSSLGASGAIYGIIGCITIINPMMMVWAFGLLLPMFVAAILWIVGDIMGVFGFGGNDVGYIAHLSGVLIGIILGFVFRVLYVKSKNMSERMKIPDSYVKDWEDRWMR